MFLVGLLDVVWIVIFPASLSGVGSIVTVTVSVPDVTGVTNAGAVVVEGAISGSVAEPAINCSRAERFVAGGPGIGLTTATFVISRGISRANFRLLNPGGCEED
ncbi:hypothetical protein AA313_de0209228 [Arthrobotrys entomopaga]|nr:hypothetical protein AA313_de0209228 [Arthrobotrys entomopaga]